MSQDMPQPLKQTRLLTTIRSRLVLGCLAMCLLVAAVGAYAVMSITRAGAVVEETYDRPMMAINFARAASLSFSRADAALLRQGVYEGADGADFSEFEERMDDFLSDLEIVEERALTARSREMTHEVRLQAQEWGAAVMAFGGEALPERALQAQADQIVETLDIIVELQANAAYLSRESAVAAVDRSQRLNTAAALAAIAVSILIIALLTRSIVRPLDAASGAANRIADGDFEAEIPAGGQDETGALLRSMSVMQDNIREMMAREKALRTTAQIRLIDALQNAHEAIVLVDADQRIIHANVKVKDFFPDLREENIHGAFYPELFRQDGSPVSVSRDTLFSEEAHAGEMRLPDGRWLRTDRSVTSEGGALITWADISDAKQRESDYLDARDRAEMASRAKTDFMTAMTHELRTPLNAVIGFAGILKGHGAGNGEQQKSYATLIHESGMNLLTIIENILEVSGAQESELWPETLPVSELVEEAAALHETQIAAKSIRLSVSGGEGACAHADPNAVKRAVGEIISNAVKFTDEGGAVSAEISALPRGVEIRIRDTGIGMSADKIPMALEPFRQLESGVTRHYEGCGLGLAVANQLIERSGGKLSVESEPGAGTCVTIWLPPAKALNPDTAVA